MPPPPREGHISEYKEGGKKGKASEVVPWVGRNLSEVSPLNSPFTTWDLPLAGIWGRVGWHQLLSPWLEGAAKGDESWGPRLYPNSLEPGVPFSLVREMDDSWNASWRAHYRSRWGYSLQMRHKVTLHQRPWGNHLGRGPIAATTKPWTNQDQWWGLDSGERPSHISQVKE